MAFRSASGIRQFNPPAATLAVVVASIHIGFLGLDLFLATTLIFVDPANEEPAEPVIFIVQSVFLLVFIHILLMSLRSRLWIFEWHRDRARAERFPR